MKVSLKISLKLVTSVDHLDLTVIAKLILSYAIKHPLRQKCSTKTKKLSFSTDFYKTFQLTKNFEFNYRIIQDFFVPWNFQQTKASRMEKHPISIKALSVHFRDPSVKQII